MTLPLPRKVGVPLAEAPLITSPPDGDHESAGRTKPQLALGSPVSSSARPQLYSASSPRSANRPGLPIYSRFTSRPSRWKSRRAAMRVRISGPGPKGNMERLEATVKEVTNWDGLSMDPEMWYPDGNCLVHLYARDPTASSMWGPAFLIPLEFLVGLDCIPLLERFLAGRTGSYLPSSNRQFVKGRPSKEYTSARYDLYIPPPPTVEGEQKLLCRTATRNFFAWICGKPLVGESLGQALVGLLNSMSEYRGLNVDNVEDILDYMEEGGYADFGGRPVHTLATLHFAEHFQFEHLYIDAFAHAVGMHDEIIQSPEYKSISDTTRSILTHAHTELLSRLTRTSASLSTFLADELSPTHLGLTAASRTHLDRFRSFLTTYWISALGSYPPPSHSSPIFSNQVLLRLRTEFKDLYAYLVDESFTAADCSPAAAQGGVCVLQSVQAFDARLGYESFLHPLPLLPTSPSDASRQVNSRTHSLRSPTLARTFSWSRPASPKKDSRLLALSIVAKASNHHKPALLEAPLVKAYREFETECILSTKEDKRTRVSAAAARKVRWILIYATLQTLRSATDILPAVRTPLTVPYHLSATLPRLPWANSPRTSLTPSSTYTLHLSLSSSSIPSSPTTPHTPASPIEPDIDHTLLTRPASSSPPSPRPRRASLPTLARSLSSAASLGRAISVIGRNPRRSSAPAPSRTPSTSMENSFTSAAEEDEEDDEEDGGMEMGCWKKQVELNQITPSPSRPSHSHSRSHSSPSSSSSENPTTPPSPLSRSLSAYDFSDTTPPSPLSQSHTPYDFSDYKISTSTSTSNSRPEMERRWSGSTAHEHEHEDVAPECTTRAEPHRQGGRVRAVGLGVGALGALLDGVVEERVFFEIEDFPGNHGGGRRVGMAM
ncbi:hypothetical protein VC83_09044 [Pseudogymnoascus destructans]|uniref:DUF8004 domain-containing protein n=2 Tax=Pseudogymnoascus destructans TaxID=655981 RepID=L8GBQ4_PSED2|nr:uncharacterized protein VC83_09044 [Pseudogymnoascus destructans]ELR10073.1 hypothetical protein GMDG_04474 [Pseudogymnoascus destructans 20631-21]OAF54582.1 hypothetical protein VC83_09044 [Pseudogymnoascus destructans]